MRPANRPLNGAPNNSGYPSNNYPNNYNSGNPTSKPYSSVNSAYPPNKNNTGFQNFNNSYQSSNNGYNNPSNKWQNPNNQNPNSEFQNYNLIPQTPSFSNISPNLINRSAQGYVPPHIAANLVIQNQMKPAQVSAGSLYVLDRPKQKEIDLAPHLARQLDIPKLSHRFPIFRVSSSDVGNIKANKIEMLKVLDFLEDQQMLSDLNLDQDFDILAKYQSSNPMVTLFKAQKKDKSKQESAAVVEKLVKILEEDDEDDEDDEDEDEKEEKDSDEESDEDIQKEIELEKMKKQEKKQVDGDSQGICAIKRIQIDLTATPGYFGSSFAEYLAENAEMHQPNPHVTKWETIFFEYVNDQEEKKEFFYCYILMPFYKHNFFSWMLKIEDEPKRFQTGYKNWKNIENTNKRRFDEVKKGFRQILEGLQHLHTVARCVRSHKNLRFENILVAANGEFALSDYGYVKDVNFFLGNKFYSEETVDNKFALIQSKFAPETFKFYRNESLLGNTWLIPSINTKFCSNADTYNLGVLLYTIFINSSVPNIDLELITPAKVCSRRADLFKNEIQRLTDEAQRLEETEGEKKQLTFDEQMNIDIAEIIKQCLSQKPMDRPSAYQLLKTHLFFATERDELFAEIIREEKERKRREWEREEKEEKRQIEAKKLEKIKSESANMRQHETGYVDLLGEELTSTPKANDQKSNANVIQQSTDAPIFSTPTGDEIAQSYKPEIAGLPQNLKQKILNYPKEPPKLPPKVNENQSTQQIEEIAIETKKKGVDNEREEIEEDELLAEEEKRKNPQLFVDLLHGWYHDPKKSNPKNPKIPDSLMHDIKEKTDEGLMEIGLKLFSFIYIKRQMSRNQIRTGLDYFLSGQKSEKRLDLEYLQEELFKELEDKVPEFIHIPRVTAFPHYVFLENVYTWFITLTGIGSNHLEYFMKMYTMNYLKWLIPNIQNEYLVGAYERNDVRMAIEHVYCETLRNVVNIPKKIAAAPFQKLGILGTVPVPPAFFGFAPAFVSEFGFLFQGFLSLPKELTAIVTNILNGILISNENMNPSLILQNCRANFVKNLQFCLETTFRYKLREIDYAQMGKFVCYYLDTQQNPNSFNRNNNNRINPNIIENEEEDEEDVDENEEEEAEEEN